MSLCTYDRIQPLYVPSMTPPVDGPRSVTPLVIRRTGVYDHSDQVDALFQLLFVSNYDPLVVHVALCDILAFSPVFDLPCISVVLLEDRSLSSLPGLRSSISRGDLICHTVLLLCSPTASF